MHGEQRYLTYTAELGGAQVYGPRCRGGEAFVKSTDPRAYGRRDTVWNLAAQVGFDKLSSALGMFQGKRLGIVLGMALFCVGSKIRTSGRGSHPSLFTKVQPNLG